MTKKPTEKGIDTIECASDMTIEEFIIGCNERGNAAGSFKDIAQKCNSIPPFTADGLAHLAGLLSDRNTASGGLVQLSGAPTDHEKVWARGFLARFNPRGHMKLNNPEFLEKFARQVVEGELEFEP